MTENETNLLEMLKERQSYVAEVVAEIQERSPKAQNYFWFHSLLDSYVAEYRSHTAESGPPMVSVLYRDLHCESPADNAASKRHSRALKALEDAGAVELITKSPGSRQVRWATIR